MNKMTCNFCEKSLLQTETKKISKNELASIHDKKVCNEDSSKGSNCFEQGSIRCHKCKQFICCIKCEDLMISHVENCKGSEKSRKVIFMCDVDCIECDYVHMPVELGGGIANVKQIICYKDHRIITFCNNYEHMLCATDEGGFWIKYDRRYDDFSKKESIGETICRQIMKEIYPNAKFIKTRHKLLRNEKTNRPLELDLYCEELKIAIEYNGKQHYEYIPFFHKNESNFEYQCERDRIKKQLCEDCDINLIVVPYTCITRKDIQELIKSNINNI